MKLPILQNETGSFTPQNKQFLQYIDYQLVVQ